MTQLPVHATISLDDTVQDFTRCAHPRIRATKTEKRNKLQLTVYDIEGRFFWQIAQNVAPPSYTHAGTT
ncbi:hypothetical protein LSAT2_002796 [Lamellibrachia satsuma]|nr:hypothetical protein LSAT2_002796 [Lamellibrachia satsuma]